MASIAALCCLLLLAACAAGEPPPDTAGRSSAGPRGLEARGAASVRPGAGGEPVLRARAVLRNGTTAAVELTVLADCPLLVRLVPAGAAGPGYDERDRPCTRAGRTVRIAPGQAQVLERDVPVAELRAGGAAAGRYRAVLAVTAGADAFDVDAGEVAIP